jgi:hypothetical protein
MFFSSPSAEDLTYSLRRAVAAQMECLDNKVARAPRGSFGTSIFCELVPSRFAKLCLEFTPGVQVAVLVQDSPNLLHVTDFLRCLQLVASLRPNVH